MRCVILSNGEYGDLEAYRKIFKNDDTIVCADGGANYAFKLGLIPDTIIGDMDSILPEVMEYFAASNVVMKKYPRQKDFTDTQLALTIAQKWGAAEILMLGSLGGRLDHAMCNLYCGIEVVNNNIKLTYFTPECWVYVVNRELVINGRQGDVVSIITLTQEAHGVSISGFEYSLDSTLLDKSNPFTISNVLTGDTGRISLEEGILLAFHYHTETSEKSL